MEFVGFFQDSKIWRFRFVIYIALMIYFGYQAYQKRFGPQIIPEDIPQGGQEVVTPDGRKARVYKVDEFMKMHGTSLEKELQKRGSEQGKAAAASAQAPGNHPGQNHEAPPKASDNAPSADPSVNQAPKN